MQARIISKRNKLYIVISYKDEFDNIKKKWFSTGLDDTKQNRKYAHSLQEEKLREFENTYKFMERGSADILFADFLEQWLDRAKTNLQVSTYATYEGQISQIAKYFRERKITLLDLQPFDIANFYAYLQKQGKSSQLCEHYHVNIRKALQTALKAGLIPFNPADRIDRPKSPKHIAKFYNREQLEKLFSCIENDDYAYIYKITAYYGLRRSEMVGIKWSNIDFKNNMITLNHTVVQTKFKGKSIIIAKDVMKNASSLRSLPLIPKVKELLLELKKKQDENKKIYGEQYEHKYDDYICVDDLGYRRNPETISAHFQMILKKNNLPKIRFHELRHSCASLLLEEGVGMKEIQEWLGHSTYTTTADIYSHLDFSSKKRVANVINSAFAEQTKADKPNKIDFEETPTLPTEKLNQEISFPKPRHLPTHRESQIKEINMVQTSSNIDKEIEELDKLIKQKQELLKKKHDMEM